MKTLKLTGWNIEHLDRLTDPNLSANQIKKRTAIIKEIEKIAPDILCITEGPAGEQNMQAFVDAFLPDFKLVKAPNNDYKILGTQWIWFLVKRTLPYACELLPPTTWYDYTGGKTWKVNFWGKFESVPHYHYRQPQVLQMMIEGQKVEFIGVHLKSKFVNNGESMWNKPDQRNQYIEEALEARVKMATEATNVRAYIDKKFEQLEKPAIFVLGDFNDGPGKEYFESRYLFFDLISNVQGDIFSANRFLNHALFDFADNLRWSVIFKDFTDRENPTDPAPQTKRILLDHILFTQPLVNWNLPKLTVEPHAGMVEHEIHDFVNSTLNSSQKTSDHRPVSIKITVKD